MANVNEILNETYFQGLYHISDTPNLTKGTIRVPKVRSSALFPLKPEGGLWLAKGLSWYRWDGGYGESGYLYRIKLSPRAKIFYLTTRNFESVLSKAKEPTAIKKKEINWETFMKKYDGMQVYNSRRYFDMVGEKSNKETLSAMMSFSAYDVPSVVIWNKNAIGEVIDLGDVKEAVKKSKKNRKDKSNG